MFNFVQIQGQFRGIAELDSRQAARKGEGRGRPESTRRFQLPQRNGLRISQGEQEYAVCFEDSADASLRAKFSSDAGTLVKL